jgi:hypothetical protein
MPHTITLENSLENKIKEELTEAGFDFKIQPIVGSATPDFLIKDQNGSSIVIESKSWEPSEKNVQRASKQAETYKKLSNADGSFVIINGLDKSIPEKGVLSGINFIDGIEQYFNTFRDEKLIPNIIDVKPSPDKLVFAAMPYSDQYDDTFDVAIQSAVTSLGAKSIRMNHDSRSGDVVQQIKELIKESVVCIADLSEYRPNVCYEAGFADATNIPVIQICRDSYLDELPFNLRNNATIPYGSGQTTKLRDKLKIELKKYIEE